MTFTTGTDFTITSGFTLGLDLVYPSTVVDNSVILIFRGTYTPLSGNAVNLYFEHPVIVQIESTGAINCTGILIETGISVVIAKNGDIKSFEFIELNNTLKIGFDGSLTSHNFKEGSVI